MEIKIGRYRTRNGREAVVTEIFEGRAYGRYRSEYPALGWYGCAWGLNGEADLGHESLDLIAPWEEPKPRLRVWRRVSDFSTGNGDIKICYTKPMGLDDWQPVPELDALFERGKE